MLHGLVYVVLSNSSPLLRFWEGAATISSIRKDKRKMAKQPGLDNRSRDNGGQTRAKNGNTRVGTLRETYGENFAEGRRSDLKLDNLLEQTGSNSLSEYLRNQKK
jgi:hypothetical protein